MFCGWFGVVVDFRANRTQRHQTRSGQAIVKKSEHGAQAGHAVLRTEGAVLDAPLRNASWEVVDFEVAQGVVSVCAQNLWA